MYHFSQLCIGDMFNTKPARWVKVSETEAICVLSGVFPLGTIREFTDEQSIILLWSCVLKSD